MKLALCGKVVACGLLVAAAATPLKGGLETVDIEFENHSSFVLPHCDGGEGESPFACVWDARHMGNHKGRSFRINREGVLKRVSHAKAHELAGF
jgi:hypothetical protein